MFDVLHELPDGLLNCTARRIGTVCPRPTLIHLSGRRQLEDCFVVHDDAGQDVTLQHLVASSDSLRLNRPAMPSMSTRNLEVVRQDCSGYLLERLPHRTLPHQARLVTSHSGLLVGGGVIVHNLPLAVDQADDQCKTPADRLFVAL